MNPRSIRFLVRAALAALLTVSSLGAQDAADVLLWEVTTAKGKAYLLGSIHAAREDMYPLDPAIESAFAKSDTLVVEVDISHIDPAAMQQRLLSSGAYGKGESLSGNLPPEDLAKLKTFLAQRNLPFPLFDRFRPWLAAMMVTVMDSNS